MIPNDTIRAAVYAALSGGGLGLTVYTSPPKSAESFILLDEIRSMEDHVQDKWTYDVGITIEVVTRFERAGSVKTGSNVATAIDAIMRPTPTTFLSITGWDVVRMALESTQEPAEITDDAKVYRFILSYQITVIKQ